MKKIMSFPEIILRVKAGRWPRDMSNKARAAHVLASFEAVTHLAVDGKVQPIPENGLGPTCQGAINRLVEFTLDFQIPSDAVVAVNELSDQDHQQILYDGKIWAHAVMQYDMLMFDDNEVQEAKRKIFAH